MGSFQHQVAFVLNGTPWIYKVKFTIPTCTCMVAENHYTRKRNFSIWSVSCTSLGHSDKMRVKIIRYCLPSSKCSRLHVLFCERTDECNLDIIGRNIASILSSFSAKEVYFNSSVEVLSASRGSCLNKNVTKVQKIKFHDLWSFFLYSCMVSYKAIGC